MPWGAVSLLPPNAENKPLWSAGERSQVSHAIQEAKADM